MVAKSRTTEKSKPDRSRFIDLWNHRGWVGYLSSLQRHFQYIRFVSFPTLKDLQDVRLEQLYVPLYLSPRHIVGEDVDKADKFPVHELLEKHRRMVVLGDPGSGKSTLISSLITMLASRRNNPIINALGRLLPLPIILRDYRIGRRISFDALLNMACDHLFRPLSKEVDRTVLREELTTLLESGQVMIMLDGLDEIGSIAVREALHAAVWSGMEHYPMCQWLLTSRIVGYERVSFHLTDIDDSKQRFDKALPSESTDELEKAEIAKLLYVCPFTDQQIDQFAQYWYTQRESDSSRAKADAAEFCERIRAHESTHRLARTPNLLTLMALIYRVRARLPNGKALLYSEIAEAYLESIDEYRKLTEFDYPLAQKKRWLARVAFEMQMRRSELKEDNSENDEKEILALEAEVKAWIADAMAKTGFSRDEYAAASFVDYIARRSGLLLPRGIDENGAAQFAFMHLSFQEYFAACFLEEQITSPLWLRGKQVAEGANQADLIRYANDAKWRETLIFLFELLADRTGWSEELAEIIFGERYQNLDVKDKEHQSLATLLAFLSVDPHAAFTNEMRRSAIRLCYLWDNDLEQAANWNEKEWPYKVNFVHKALFSADQDELSLVWDEIVDISKSRKVEVVFLAGLPISNIKPIVQIGGIRYLDLDEAPVSYIEPLSQVETLQMLSLKETPVSNLIPLSNLTNLQSLYLSSTSVSDVSALAQLSNLQTLDLSSTSVSDVSALAQLSNLQTLDLRSTSVSDVSALAQLSNLQSLYLRSTSISEKQIDDLRIKLPNTQIYY